MAASRTGAVATRTPPADRARPVGGPLFQEGRAAAAFARMSARDLVLVDSAAAGFFDRSLGEAGQYEVFTLRRGTKWVGNAIGYVAVVGPTSRQTVMVANLGPSIDAHAESTPGQ